MALLKCCECGHDVSEYAEKCSNCGCPIERIKDSALLHDENKVTCNINEKVMDVTWIRDELLLLDAERFNYYKFYCSPEMDGIKAAGKHVNDKYFIPAGEFSRKVGNYLDLTQNPARHFLYLFMESNFTLKEFNGESLSKWSEQMLREAQIDYASKPHCPYCNSTNVEKLSFTKKAVSIGGLGILSNKIGKTYQCKNCKSTW